MLVTLFWGITFPLIRSALVSLGPHQFVAYRFALALAVFAPLLGFSREARRSLRLALLPGLGLGILAWSSYFSQTLGLQTVPAGRAAFITGTNVILVPLLSPLFRAGRPTRLDALAAVVASAGLYLLTDPQGGGFGVGDAWILLCAFMYALYIHSLQKVLRTAHDAVALAFAQILGVAFCAWGVVVARGDIRAPLHADAVVALLVCALLATVGTFWLQTRYQGLTTPERAALIFAMEPVFAALFAYWLLGETLGFLGWIGGAVILVAVLGAELLGRKEVET